jgi:hypothetical protein
VALGVRSAILALIFSVQVAGIVYARFVPTRYLCWAPYDQLTFYRIEADTLGRSLTEPAIAARYRLPPIGRENRSIHHVLNAIAQFESTYGRRDSVRVRVVYRINGGPEQTWTAPD